jgi:hypothetical protein
MGKSGFIVRLIALRVKILTSHSTQAKTNKGEENEYKRN